ncbi:MAG: non-homologous end-joining DNA ligase [Syntrophothermus sp.]
MTGLIKPMLAKEIPEPFNDKDWLFEVKWDGYRALALVIHGTVQLYSRYNNLFNRTYPDIVRELSKITSNVVIDGEIVLLNEHGRPDFQKLQNYQNNQEYPVIYYVFDLLSKDGKTLFDIPLLKRKEQLKKILPESELVRYNDHILEKGLDFFETIAQFDLEGIIAKKIRGLYYPGKRSGEWVKIKTHTTRDTVICGFTEPAGSRKYFGSLVLGLETEGRLVYTGNVGTGFDDRLLKKVYERLKPLITDKSPFNEPVRAKTPVTWVRPELQCEVRFSEMTSDHRLRHPVFITIKEEKYAGDRKKIKK